MSTDPWATASEGSLAAEQAASAQDRLIDADPEADIESRLFGGEPMPSVFTKKHDVGDEITGTIRDLPFEKDAFFYKEGGQGDPKFWENAPAQGERKVTSKAIGNDGRPNKRVKDLVLPLDTAYRFTPEQLEARNLTEDSGVRAWYMGGGDAEKQFKAAIRAAGVRKVSDLVGMRLTAKRTGKVKSGDFASWTYAVKLSK